MQGTFTLTLDDFMALREAKSAYQDLLCILSRCASKEGDYPGEIVYPDLSVSMTEELQSFIEELFVI